MIDTNQLIDQYVSSFARLDELSADELLDPVAWELSSGDRDSYGFRAWQPAKVSTAASCLKRLYRDLPAPFPPLFEALVLSYRWAEVDLRSYRLLANPPGPDLSGLLKEMSHDSALWKALLPAGYIGFGKGPGIDYDPVCFDTRSGSKSGDYRIVKVDHEEILCNDRIQVVAELAPSFEDLMLQTIRLSQSR